MFSSVTICFIINHIFSSITVAYLVCYLWLFHRLLYCQSLSSLTHMDIATYYLFKWQASAVQVALCRPNERERPKFTPPRSIRKSSRKCTATNLLRASVGSLYTLNTHYTIISITGEKMKSTCFQAHSAHGRCHVHMPVRGKSRVSKST